MPIVILRLKEKKILEYPLAVGQSCRIGRRKDNDIVIDNLAVSGHHARIESVATTFVLKDLDSTNGTFVNDIKITMHNLRHNDVITIGKHELIFDRSDLIKKAAKEPDIYQDDKTRIIDTSQFIGGQQVDTGSTANKKSPGTAAAPQQPQTSFFSRLLQKLFG
ncbi:MAG: FHA domain-containing protein [Desulforhopalus sp.]|nr:FHA domain-containing protein [Desulforhopalus sp.]